MLRQAVPPNTLIVGVMPIWGGNGSYVGLYKNSKREGQGVSTWQGLERSESGSYVNDRLEGLGKLHFSSGARFEGIWKGGVICGEGTFYDKGGKGTTMTWDAVEGSGSLSRDSDWDRLESLLADKTKSKAIMKLDKIAIYKPTANVVSHRVRRGPSLGTEQVGSVDSRTVLKVKDVDGDWLKLHESMYEELKASINFR